MRFVFSISFIWVVTWNQFWVRGIEINYLFYFSKSQENVSFLSFRTILFCLMCQRNPKTFYNITTNNILLSFIEIVGLSNFMKVHSNLLFYLFRYKHTEIATTAVFSPLDILQTFLLWNAYIFSHRFLCPAVYGRFILQIKFLEFSEKCLGDNNCSTVNISFFQIAQTWVYLSLKEIVIHKMFVSN